MMEPFRTLQYFWQRMFTKRPLANDDVLAKYVFRLKELRADGSIRPGNLKPREGEKLSMFEVTKLKHNEICTHGHSHVGNLLKKRIHIGYGKFLHESFVRLDLKTIYDNRPPRHVSVVFPENPEKRRELAKALANEFIAVKSQTNKKYFSECIS